MLDANRRGHFAPGGIVGYPLEQVHEEVAYLAYHLHWPPRDLLNFEHDERRRWVREVAEIHRRAQEASREDAQ